MQDEAHPSPHLTPRREGDSSDLILFFSRDPILSGFSLLHGLRLLHKKSYNVHYVHYNPALMGLVPVFGRKKSNKKRSRAEPQDLCFDSSM